MQPKQWRPSRQAHQESGSTCETQRNNERSSLCLKILTLDRRLPQLAWPAVLELLFLGLGVFLSFPGLAPLVSLVPIFTAPTFTHLLISRLTIEHAVAVRRQKTSRSKYVGKEGQLEEI